jgi:hypothetical protein
MNARLFRVSGVSQCFWRDPAKPSPRPLWTLARNAVCCAVSVLACVLALLCVTTNAEAARVRPTVSVTKAPPSVGAASPARPSYHSPAKASSQPRLPVVTGGQGSGSPQLNSRQARRESMRLAGIPTSQQPTSQVSTSSGRQLAYGIPKPGSGTQKMVVTNQRTDRVAGHQPHWEAGPVKIPERSDALGRLRVTNQKAKVNYGQ